MQNIIELINSSAVSLPDALQDGFATRWQQFLEAGPALPARVHLALVGVAAVTLVAWWQRLGLLLP